MTNAEKLTDKQYLQDPGQWFQWPYCPLKRRKDNWHEFGYVAAVEGQLLTVRNGNMWAASKDDPIWATYETVDALLADGWVVD